MDRLWLWITNILMRLEGWDDVKFPATAVNPPGGVGSPGRDTTDGRLLFDANATEIVYIADVFPHTGKENSVIRPHVHWQKTTSATGAVYWRLRYKQWNIGNTEPAWSAYIPGALRTTDTNTAGQALVTSFGDIATTGWKQGSSILFELTREGGNASDTYGADAKMHQFDYHIFNDRVGSASEFN